MELLRQVISAAGGAERWRDMIGFTAHVAIRGSLIDQKYRPDALRDIVVEADVRDWMVCISGVDAQDDRLFCRAGQVGFATGNGDVARVEARSTRDMEKRASYETWDVFDIAQHCSYCIWSYVAMPYLLQSDTLRCEIVPPSGPSHALRALRIEFPETVAIYPRQQKLYFDQNGTPVRMDYRAHEFGGAFVSQSIGAHHDFSGYRVPTLRRSKLMDAERSAPLSLLDVEIFDVDVRRG